MTYLCARFIYKSPRLPGECAEGTDGIGGRSAAPPVFPLAFGAVREAVVLATESRQQPFLAASAAIYHGNDQLPTCCRACWGRSQNARRLREKAGWEPAPPHPPSQHAIPEEGEQEHIAACLGNQEVSWSYSSSSTSELPLLNIFG